MKFKDVAKNIEILQKLLDKQTSRQNLIITSDEVQRFRKKYGVKHVLLYWFVTNELKQQYIVDHLVKVNEGKLIYAFSLIGRTDLLNVPECIQQVQYEAIEFLHQHNLSCNLSLERLLQTAIIATKNKSLLSFLLYLPKWIPKDDIKEFALSFTKPKRSVSFSSSDFTNSKRISFSSSDFTNTINVSFSSSDFSNITFFDNKPKLKPKVRRRKRDEVSQI